MKIGILTFHDAFNYGAVLQAHALQRYLTENTGHSIEIIDYIPDHKTRLFRIKPTSRNPIKKIFFRIAEKKYGRDIYQCQEKFESFIKEFHSLSPKKYRTEEDFKCSDYECVISGSDQVFNPKKDSNIYYLGFKSNIGIKIAYAPSFGVSKITDEFKRLITPWINDYKYLSSREEGGAEILKDIIGKDIPVVCDPICLVSKSQWESILQVPPVENFIFVFDLNGGKNLMKVANRLKKQTGLEIMYTSLKSYHPYVSGCKIIHNLGPLEWLGFIKKASYVVTDSFHAIMFSLILETKVIANIASQNTSSRIYTIMSKLNIIDQIVEASESFSIYNISFKDYKKELENFIEASKLFLSSSLRNL